MNIYTNLIINTKTGRGVSKSRKFHLQCISVPKKCLRHTMRHAIVSRFQIPMFTSERNAVRTALFARLVIGDTSYSLFFKGLLFRSVHCKTGKSFGTLLSQWASFLHEKQDVTQVPSRDRISKRTSTTTIGLRCFANVCCYYRLCWVSYSSYNVLRLQVSEWNIYILILMI